MPILWYNDNVNKNKTQSTEVNNMNEMQKEQFNKLVAWGFGWKSTNPEEMEGFIQEAHIKWNFERQCGAYVFEDTLMILNWDELEELIEYITF